MGVAYKDAPENFFLQKWTGQKILDGSDWSSQTKRKQKKTNVDEPLIFLARPCMRRPLYKKIIIKLKPKSSDGDTKVFEEVFNFSCPKFVSPTQPPIVPPYTNTHLDPTNRQWKVFEDELEIQAKIPGTRR